MAIIMVKDYINLKYGTKYYKCKKVSEKAQKCRKVQKAQKSAKSAKKCKKVQKSAKKVTEPTQSAIKFIWIKSLKVHKYNSLQ